MSAECIYFPFAENFFWKLELVLYVCYASGQKKTLHSLSLDAAFNGKSVI